MKKTMCMCVAVMVLAIACACYGQTQRPVTKYNPMEGKWQTTYPSSTLEYNPMENTWEYVSPPPAAPRNNRLEYGTPPQPVYNPMEGKWEFPK